MAKSPVRQPARPPTPQPQLHQQVHLQSQQWTGPLPPPAALEQFNQIIPNGAERIMGLVEREQAHRIAHEETALKAKVNDTRRGAWMGFIIIFGAIGAAIFSVHLGAHPLVSATLVGLPLAAIIRSIINGKPEKN